MTGRSTLRLTSDTALTVYAWAVVALAVGLFTIALWPISLWVFGFVIAMLTLLWAIVWLCAGP